VNTDDGDYLDKGKTGRNKVSAQLAAIAFGQQLHELKLKTDATWITLRPLGITPGAGPTSDRKIYQRVFMLDIKVIVPFTSLVT